MVITRSDISSLPIEYLHLSKFRMPQRENAHNDVHWETFPSLTMCYAPRRHRSLQPHPCRDVALSKVFSGLAPSAIAIVLTHQGAPDDGGT